MNAAVVRVFCCASVALAGCAARETPKATATLAPRFPSTPAVTEPSATATIGAKLMPFSSQPEPMRPLTTMTTPTAQESRRPLGSVEPQGLLAAMTDEQKAGQVMMIGFEGTALTPQLRAAVTDLHPAGVIIFERNVASPRALARLTADLQALAHENEDPPLLVAIDQEGGRVARLKEKLGFTEFPSAMAVGATGDPENARRIGEAMAQELLAVGINVNFAPDLDVNNNPANPVIGTRSFGSDAKQVGRFGVAFAEGLQGEGVMAVAKHFPGHGDTDVDSHISLPIVPHDGERLQAVELAPFRSAIAADVAGIMTAHVTFPAIEPIHGLPATLSPTVLSGLLRGELGYDGLVFTDSLEMGALAKNGYPVPIAAAMALAAGADVLLFNDGDELHRAAHALILSRLASGELAHDRLDEAARRVLNAKERYGLLVPRQPASGSPDVGRQSHRNLSRQIATQAITLIRNDNGLLPLSAVVDAAVVEPRSAQGLGKALGVTPLVVADHPSVNDMDAASKLGGNGRIVVVVTSDVLHYPGQARLVARLLGANLHTVVVAVRGPYDLLAFPRAPVYLASYGSNPPLLEALARVLRGEAFPLGGLPVEMPGLYGIGAGMKGFSRPAE